MNKKTTLSGLFFIFISFIFILYLKFFTLIIDDRPYNKKNSLFKNKNAAGK